MITSNNNSFTPTFFVVPAYILDLPGMNLCHLRVYEAMFQFWNKNRHCFLSEEALCERSGKGRTQVYESLNYLEKNNLLIRRKVNGKRYLVQPEKPIETDCSFIEPTSGNPDVDVRKPGQTTSGNPDHNIKKVNKEYNSLYNVDSVESTPEIEKENVEFLFSIFYNAYPNKQKPARALQEFRRLNPTASFLNRLLDDLNLRMQNNWKGRDKGRIPHPSTYLRDKEWQGDIHKPVSCNFQSPKRSMTIEEVWRA